MANDYIEELQKLDTPWFYRIAWGGGALLFLLSAYLWWNYGMVKPDRVFWGTISNNLVITGVTKQTVTNEQSGSEDQIQQISLGAQNTVLTKSTIKQQATDAASTTVVTESIATPKVDYARYLKIETDQKTGTSKTFDFGSALNVWSKQDIPDGASGSFGAAVYGLFPLAYIQGNERNNIVNQMKQRDTYKVDYGTMKKRTQNGRLIYEYTVSIDPQQYVAALKSIDKASGLNRLQEADPSQYANSQPVQVTVSIDARAQQLVSVSYPDNTKTETYLGYGVFNSPQLPAQTITKEALQEKLNGILNAE